MWATSAIFQKIPKVNNHPLSEKFAKSCHSGYVEQFLYFGPVPPLHQLIQFATKRFINLNGMDKAT
jgi:hypothetical protein